MQMTMTCVFRTMERCFLSVSSWYRSTFPTKFSYFDFVFALIKGKCLRSVLNVLEVNNFLNVQRKVLSLVCLPFFFFSTAISSPSSRRQIIFGAGKPSARQDMLIFWFSLTATEDGVLSISKIFGGTKIYIIYYNYSTF